MKINDIKIRNFKGIKEFDYNPSKSITYVMGKNGKGKTSFLKAFDFALTGDIPSINYIGNYNDRTSVEFVSSNKKFFREKKLDKNGRIVNKCCIDDKKVNLGDLNEEIDNISGSSITSNHLVFSSDLLRSLSSAEFGGFLNKYIPKKLNLDVLMKYINPNEKELELMKQFFPAMPNTFDIDTLKGSYENFFNKRKLTKKELEALKIKVEDKIDKPNYTLEQITEVRTQLLKNDSEYKTGQKLLKIWEENEKKKNTYKEKLVTLEKELSKIIVSDNIEIEIKELKNKKNELETKYKDSLLIMNTLQNNLSIFTKQIKTLDTDTCPLSKVIKCTSIEEKIKAKEEIQKEISSIKESAKKQKEIIEKILKEAKKIAEELEKKEDESKLLIKKKALLSQIEVYKTEINAKIDKPVIPKLIPDLDKKILILNEKEAILKKYTEQQKDINKYNTLAAECEACNSLVKKLSPSGVVMENIMEQYMKIFNDTCKETIEELKIPYDIKLSPINGIVIMVKVRDKDYVSFNALSEGEQAMVSFIIMDMLNKLTNVNIIVMDSLECLDDENYNALIKTLVKYKDRYDHIIISIVDKENKKDFISNDKEIYDLLKDNADLIAF